ncbi:hypothetical protein JK359_12375 [Streptomyces actinomycinicus]|uniref:Secreted protein n=1 Tax=Streptomyces actinomycinicus TaxID=1695166 RepID=A0A937JNU4_9ACTN|nr:HAD domain-containing protein [Streptomyces actinomycinicus]MBL1082767.1 hypothetical protein [Streptomyces actinomycinicus]
MTSSPVSVTGLTGPSGPPGRPFRFAPGRRVAPPVLFLDVDGPLIPFGPAHGRARAASAVAAGESPGPGNPLLGRLDPAVGPRLAALGCELVWATTWLDLANEVVAPRIGLPGLPLVRWPGTSADEGPRGLHWKTRHLVEWAGRRPFVWVDDEITAMDRLWVSAQRREPFLLHRVDPDEGLGEDDFTAIGDWLRATVPQHLPGSSPQLLR